MKLSGRCLYSVNVSSLALKGPLCQKTFPYSAIFSFITDFTKIIRSAAERVAADSARLIDARVVGIVVVGGWHIHPKVEIELN